MRLLTHNFITSKANGTENGYPLQLIVKEVEVKESSFRENFIRHIIQTLEWNVFCQAASLVGVDSLPPEINEENLKDTNFLKAVHHVMMDIHVIEGELRCPATGKIYEIIDGIPNMMLTEEELN
mmetsp:Transcript_1335/g.1775  ORF Transcript_1335/g.1775 Transcript_1335/m.1775 type:complete len:124 (+) Transcript_1335:45-416(+)